MHLMLIYILILNCFFSFDLYFFKISLLYQLNLFKLVILNTFKKLPISSLFLSLSLCQLEIVAQSIFHLM